MKKKVLITAGGIDGHIYPALSLAEQLQKRSPDIEILFVGGKLANNRFFEQNYHPFKNVDCGRSLFGLQTFNIGRGIWQSHRIIQDYSPDIVVGFGSYHTFPPL